ncbi:MAG: hypothetical protein N2323_07835, partial [candidate division WOR-3 bacterium]|nr:hypothetical protein [candidate division WOR-3 bacterium]
IHHRAPVWMILTIFGFVGASQILKIKVSQTRQLILLGLVFLIAYFGFNKVVYDQYLPKAIEHGLFYGFETLFYSINKILGLEGDIVEKYMYPPSPTAIFSEDYNYISSLKLILSFTLILFIPFLKLIIKKTSFSSLNSKDLLFVTLLFCFVAEHIFYSMLGLSLIH